MNVCGVLVHAKPDDVGLVETGLRAIPGAEAHGQADGGRLIVTVEDTEELSAADALAKLNALPGVVAAALVYHEFEPDERSGSNETEEVIC